MTAQALARAHRSLEAAVASLAGVSLVQGPRSIERLNRALQRVRTALLPPVCPVAAGIVEAPAPKAVVVQPECKVPVLTRGRAGARAPERSRVRLRRPAAAELEVRPSAWDPEPLDEQLEASRCRALLLEIVRRAVYDWVLYRQHRKLELKAVAADAYTWLFEEEDTHPWVRRRRSEGRGLTSLTAICEVLDLDPETVRERARRMDIRTILTAGRPPEVRRREVSEDSDYQEHSVSGEVDISGYGDDPGANYYENHYSVHTNAM